MSTFGDVEIDVFIAWFTANGGCVDTQVMGITEILDSGRGAIALCDIPTGHTLFTLPRALTLSTRTSPLPALFGLGAWRVHRLHRGWVGLILCIMWEDAWAHERAADGDSEDKTNTNAKWAPYIRTLPSTFDTPMFWSAEELEELKGTAVIDKIGRDDAERAYWESVVPAIKVRTYGDFPQVSSNSSLFDLNSSPRPAPVTTAHHRPIITQYPLVQTSPVLFPPSHHDKWYTLDAYHCAGSRILSRSFTVSRWTDDGEGEGEGDHEGEGADDAEEEVPGANTSLGSAMEVDDPQQPSHEDAGSVSDSHSEDEDEEDPSDVAMVPMADLLNARWGSENAKLFYEPLVLRMTTTKEIKQGEQIFNTYGDPPNSDLLRRYGHVDLVRLDSASSDSACGKNEDVRMSDNNVRTDSIDVKSMGNPSDVVEIRADLAVEVVRGFGSGSKKDMDERIEWWLDEGEDEYVVSTSFRRLVSRLLGVGPSGSADDERLLPGILTKHRRDALVVRLGEKRILRDAREVVKWMLAEVEEGKEKAKRDEGGGKGGRVIKSTGTKRIVSGADGERGPKRARR
ncbi:hypothetical protein PAXINDRAFT_101548 [Paxillus involutus ATCC 200175]|uniref:Ribosomal lysine N-methyltransferase 4 n=1 Tax=Paxillus involutus ATCC 200175 TaxID=664439 RepID=A0A0C9T7Y7_PAXIN|nr:hypothetical protein PAXINDRAFT_101548 [Paxillus involutus ATCC 200175]